MQAEKFVTLLKKNGFDFFTGVPCSYLAPLAKVLNESCHDFHVPAVREDLAVGLAAGAFLSGKLPVVYMQNSGLGYSLEVFASLILIYRIPLLVLLSYRGPEDDNMEEHIVMGQHTEELLKTFGLRYSVFDGSISEQWIRELKQSVVANEQPFFLLITRGSLG
jgi:sulfopyruvate decarboxylase alpha subunit